jgi:hypothetical protein
MFPWKSEALGDLSSLSDMKMLWSFDSSGKYGTFSALQILVFLELFLLIGPHLLFETIRRQNKMIYQ